MGFPAEEQPLPAVVYLLRDSRDYIPESDPEEDPKDEEDPEEDPAYYPADIGDDDEEDEEEEHLASADSTVVALPAVDRTDSIFFISYSPFPQTPSPPPPQILSPPIRPYRIEFPETDHQRQVPGDLALQLLRGLSQMAELEAAGIPQEGPATARCTRGGWVLCFLVIYKKMDQGKAHKNPVVKASHHNSPPVTTTPPQSQTLYHYFVRSPCPTAGHVDEGVRLHWLQFIHRNWVM
ncbi:hypothetical protein Tco_0779891 [Tanacetum coccineum]